jgi:hypothetical protein
MAVKWLGVGSWLILCFYFFIGPEEHSVRVFRGIAALASVLFACESAMSSGSTDVAIQGEKAALSASGGESFRSVLDGKTLDGWNAADMSYWPIEDGAITGSITKAHPCMANRHLVKRDANHWLTKAA